MDKRIQAQAKRRANARQALGDYDIEPQGEGVFRVEKADGTTYIVNMTAETCTCPDFLRRLSRRQEYAGVWCKHLHLCAANFLR